LKTPENENDRLVETNQQAMDRIAATRWLRFSLSTRVVLTSRLEKLLKILSL